jgi:hypothetical protein
VRSPIAALLAAALAAAPAAAGGDAGPPAPPAAADDLLAAAVLAPSGELLQLQAALDPDGRLAGIPGVELGGLLPGALPPPPTTVIRETRYYGTVTVDHRAHLARRASCRSCHGPGPVTKLTFTPKVAHERCVGCHQTLAKGPEKCQGCHVQPPPPAQLAASEEKKPEVRAEPPGPDPANVAAALAAADTAASGPSSGVFAFDPFQRYLELGLAAGRGQGFSVRLASHESNLVLTQSVDYQVGRGETRTFSLLGAGLSHLGRGRISFEGVALAGADVVTRPGVGVLPALGARVGAEFRPDHGFVQRVSLSFTGVADLSRHASGQEVRAFTLYGTLATGFRVP